MLCDRQTDRENNTRLLKPTHPATKAKMAKLQSRERERESNTRLVKPLTPATKAKTTKLQCQNCTLLIA